jgi:hypothetical protein
MPPGSAMARTGRQQFPIRGYERLRLIRDLALGELSPRELARDYRLSVETVIEFRESFHEEISELRAALANSLPIETAALWITRKQNRLAEMQAEAEEIRDFLEELRSSGIRWSRAHRDMLRTYLEILRQCADELGAYPQRNTAPARTGSTVHYVIDAGEQTDSLK